MPNLFGLDIAKIVNDSIAGAGGVLDGTLTVVTAGTRTPGSLTGGTNPTTVAHAFKGFIEERNEVRIPGQLQTVSGKVVSILGASLPAGIEPSTGDRVNIESTDYDVIAIISRDPAAALFECLVEV